MEAVEGLLGLLDEGILLCLGEGSCVGHLFDGCGRAPHKQEGLVFDYGRKFFGFLFDPLFFLTLFF